MQFAKAIKSKPIRGDFAAILANRDLLKIDLRLRQLCGDVVNQARALLKL